MWDGDGGPGVPVELDGATFTAIEDNGAAPGLWRTKRDRNNKLTWLDGYDARGRPGRIVEGWVDTVNDGAFGAGDTYARLRDFSYHPRLASELAVTQTSVLNSAGTRVEIHDYDSDLDPVPNEAATDLLYRRVVQGWSLDASGSQVEFTDTTTHTYDGNDRLTQVAGPRSAELTTIAYDATTGSRSSIRRYLNGPSSSYLEWTFSDFDTRGNPQTVTDPNARVTTFTYDSLGRVLTATPPCETTVCGTPADAKVTFTYDVDGNLTKVQFPDDTAGADVFLELGYDAAKPDLLRFLKDSQGNAIVYTYQKGRVEREERYTGFTSLQNMGTRVGDATFDYNAAGRMIAAFNPLFSGGNVSSAFSHDAKGNVTGISDENATHAAGVLDPLRKDTLGYDALDRLLSIAQVRGAATTTTSFAYDALSNVTQVTDAASKTTDLLHDDRGNLVETVSPDTGRTRFVYDAAGNLVTKIENAPPPPGTAGARLTTYTYDGLNRLTGINLSNDADVDWIFTYDTDAAKNQKGRLAKVTNGLTGAAEVATSLDYTQRGDVAVDWTKIDGLDYFTEYHYDAAGNRVFLQGPSGGRFDTAYAGLRPSQLTITAGTRTEIVEIDAWYPFGPPTVLEIPPDNASGRTVKSTRTVNQRGQIERILVERMDVDPAIALLDRTYDYDETAGGALPNDPGPNLDRMESSIRIDPIIGDPYNVTESRAYFYDPLDRLAKATTGNGATELHEYAYDPVGNRTSQTDAGASTGYTFETASNRLDAATGTAARDFAHDAYGNRIYDGAVAYAGTPSLVYDEANRLVTVKDPASGFATLGSYTYDAFGRRIKKVAGGKTILFFYDTEGHLIEEVEKVSGVANDVARFYVFLEDELVALVDKQKEVGAAAWAPPLARGIEIEPPFVILFFGTLAGVGLGIATRRWPVGLAAVGSSASILLLCAGVPPMPRMTFVHTDPLGTPIAVTKSPKPENGGFLPAGVIWHASYEPFGTATIDDDPDDDGSAFSLAVRFPGQYEDAETGYHFNMARTYDPAVGRYLQPDPIGFDGGSHLFAYARNNPLRFIDRDGEAVEDQSSPGNPLFFGLPTDWHFNRNRNNHCPECEPKGGIDCRGGVWTTDFFGNQLHGGYRAYRGTSSFDGSQCAYDHLGRLVNSGPFQGTFDYSPPRSVWGTVKHLVLDFAPGKALGESCSPTPDDNIIRCPCGCD